MRPGVEDHPTEVLRLGRPLALSAPVREPSAMRDHRMVREHVPSWDLRAPAIGITIQTPEQRRLSRRAPTDQGFERLPQCTDGPPAEAGLPVVFDCPDAIERGGYAPGVTTLIGAKAEPGIPT